MRILLVEDEPALADAVVAYLSGRQWVCQHVPTYVKAEEYIALYHYDAFLIDLTLPDGEGLNLVKQVKRQDESAGIIILTARDGISDRVLGLELGADDYLPKPFHLSELVARVHAVLRRRQFGGKQELIWAGLRMLPEAQQVYCNQTPIILTPKEFALLRYLFVNAEKVITKEALAEHLIGQSADLANSFDFVYTHIKNLRRKIQDAGGIDCIDTVYGIGYKLTKT